ncbi:HMG-box [Heliocybe sulcata]|uniref:HMG-box n=1 Tax=Heliocybe sulcata TaxID=5364 RepID=A0A5C3NHB6_9AGAM|nr:HMG-box [Heliocybe sulcata]
MEGAAHLEVKKLQLIAALQSVAEQMRNCAAIADDFTRILHDTPASPGTAAAFQPLLNAAAPFVQAPPVKGGKRKVQALDEEGTGKRAKKVKDPNAPKRPPSSYLLFQNEVRKVIHQQNPNMPNSELLKEISRRWKELSPKDKEVRRSCFLRSPNTNLALQVYERRTKDRKAQYDIAKAAYDLTNNPNAVKSPTPAAAITPPAPEVCIMSRRSVLDLVY